MLVTNNIFIDTQTFVANNFFLNENLNRIASFGENGMINLYLTEITIREIQSNIKEELQNAQEEINRFKKTIQHKGRILKNIEEFQKYINLPKLDLQVDYDRINNELEKFIEKGNVKIIPYKNADLSGIVTKYFDRVKPFGAGKKKYEFPDAIVLSALEEWCKNENCKIYVISGDKDMTEYISNNIKPIPNIREILNKIIRQYKNDRIEWVQQIYNRYEDTIIELISEKFEEGLLVETKHKLLMEDIEVSDVTLFEASIVHDNEENGETIFQLDADIYFSAEVEYDDHSLSSYEREDYNWNIPEKRRSRINIGTTQTIEISIESSYEDKLNKGIEDYSIYCIYCSIPDTELIMEKIKDY